MASCGKGYVNEKPFLSGFLKTGGARHLPKPLKMFERFSCILPYQWLNGCCRLESPANAFDRPGDAIFEPMHRSFGTFQHW
jgi:hypothetical protein